jgi:hypothetical protein
MGNIGGCAVGGCFHLPIENSIGTGNQSVRVIYRNDIIQTLAGNGNNAPDTLVMEHLPQVTN